MVILMKKILFTGSRSGIIGKVIDSISSDYFIYISVHTLSELERVKEKYKDFKNIKCLKIDVTCMDDLKVLYNLDIDILVSNAAIGESGSIIDMDMDKVRDNFEVNVFGNFSLCQIVLKNMIRKGSGRVIFMSSLAGIIPIPFLGSYCASKASIIKFAECLRMELKILNKNIDVCLIEPGLYNTGFNRLMLDKKYDDDFAIFFDKQIKLIRSSENLVLFLFEKRCLDSIVMKIVKVIKKEKPNFVYRAPLFQSLTAKLYNLFN